MKITINGQSKQFDQIQSLEELIHQFSPQNKRVIAEVNGEIVKSNTWAKKTVSEGDVIELVSFVGGG